MNINTNTINEFMNMKNGNMEHIEKMKRYTNTNNSAVNEIANMFIEKCKIIDSLYDLCINFTLNEKESKEITNITVKKRFSDYHACLEGYPGIWGCGRNICEAVGSAIMNHPKKFNLNIIEE